jgi:uncharacterized coiled-coil protein SlyX
LNAELEYDELTDQRESSEILDDGLADEFGAHPLRPARRRRLLPMIAAIVLLVIGSALAFVWYSMYSDGLPPFASPQMPAPLTADTGIKLEDFRAFQERVNRIQLSTEQLLTAQQLEIVRLSDQLNILSGKVDLLQRPAASVDNPPQPPPPMTRSTPPRKKNASSRSDTSPISVGGAPLPGR